MGNKVDRVFAWADKAISGRLAWLMVCAAVFALQATMIWVHQPWADELQAMLIATEAPNAATLLAWLRYEGHPPLWYWLLQALDYLAEPRATLWLAALLLAGLTQAIILLASPFARIERLLIATSQFVVFEFLTISRGTTLGVAIVFLIMVAWRSRWFWLLIAFLPLVDFLFGVLSGALLVLRWREKPLWWPGIALWLAASAFAAWSVIPPADMVNASEALQMESGPVSWFFKLSGLALPFQGGINPQWNTPVVPFAGVAWVAFLALCWLVTRGWPWHRALIFGFLGFTLAFSLAVYPIGLRHLMLGVLLLIVLVWKQREAGDPPKAVFGLWLVVASVSGLATAFISATQGFDSADRALTEIESRGLADKHWIAFPEWRVPGISGRAAMEFGRPGENCAFRFVRWDHANPALGDPDRFKAMLRDEIDLHGKSYLISDIEFEGFPRDLIAPLAAIPAGYDGIPYYIYVVGADAAEKSVTLPPCAPGAPLEPLGKK